MDKVDAKVLTAFEGYFAAIGAEDGAVHEDCKIADRRTWQVISPTIAPIELESSVRLVSSLSRVILVLASSPNASRSTTTPHLVHVQVTDPRFYSSMKVDMYLRPGDLVIFPAHVRVSIHQLPMGLQSTSHLAHVLVYDLVLIDTEDDLNFLGPLICLAHFQVPSIDLYRYCCLTGVHLKSNQN